MNGMIPSPTAVGVHFLATLLKARVAWSLAMAALIAFTWRNTEISKRDQDEEELFVEGFRSFNQPFD